MIQPDPDVTVAIEIRPGEHWIVNSPAGIEEYATMQPPIYPHILNGGCQYDTSP